MIPDLETPIPVIDMARVEANLKRMQDYADQHGLKMRPHIKTHKMLEMAKRQLELGAIGLTCQKLTEAEVMLETGCTDILISYPMIGPEKAKRLAELAGKVSMTVAADSALAVETAAEAARLSGAEIGVLVEFDSGMGRTGVVSPEAALALIQQVTETAGLRLAGLMTYPSNAKTTEFIKALRPMVEAAGLAMPPLSGGGTPGAAGTHELGCVDELRVGTYIYNDRNIVSSGAATYDDCAALVLATVVSKPKPGHFILDCGTKTLTSDPYAGGLPGHGLLIDYPEAVIERLTEEHGMVSIDPSLPEPELGEKVWILPNHICPVMNLHDRVAVRMPDGSIEERSIAARGCTR